MFRLITNPVSKLLAIVLSLLVLHIGCAVYENMRLTGRYETLNRKKVKEVYSLVPIHLPELDNPSLIVEFRKYNVYKEHRKVEEYGKKKTRSKTLMWTAVTVASVWVTIKGLELVEKAQAQGKDTDVGGAILLLFSIPWAGTGFIFMISTALEEGKPAHREIFQDIEIKDEKNFELISDTKVEIKARSLAKKWMLMTDANGRVSLNIADMMSFVQKGQPLQLTFQSTEVSRVSEKFTIPADFFAALDSFRVITRPPDLFTKLSFDDSKSWSNQTIDGAETSSLVAFIENRGEGKARGVKLLISSNNPDISIVPIFNIGEIPPDSTIEKTIPLTAAKDILDGKAIFIVETKELYGNDASPARLAVPVRHLDKPALEIISYRLNDGKTGRADGNANGILENEEVIELDVTVRNQGVGVALNTKLAIASINEGIKVLQREVFLGDIVPNQPKGGKLAFKIPRVFQSNQLKFELDVVDSLAASHIREPYDEMISIRKPDLEYDFQMLNSFGKPVTQITNGADFIIEILPRNKGKLAATQVALIVTTSPSIQVDKGNVEIGRLEASASGTPVWINLKVPRTIQETRIPLRIQLNQSDFPRKFEERIIEVNFLTPRLSFNESLNTSDGDLVIKQRETAELSIHVRNEGDLVAEDVRVMLEINRLGIDFREGEKLLGRVPPRGVDSTKFNFIVKGSAASGPLPILVKIRQADGFPGVEKKLEYMISKADTIEFKVSGKETERVQGFLNPNIKQPITTRQIETSSNVSDWFTVSVNQPISTIKEIALDGEPTTALQIEQIGKGIRVRGSDELKQKLRPGPHQISVNGIQQYICFWKGLRDLQHYQKESLGESYALIIGVSKYGKGFRNLPEVEKQAKELGQLLEINNFKVTYLLDTEREVTRQVVDAAISELNKKMNLQRDRLLFYYGGHGKAVKPAFGDSLAYLILNDYEMADLDNACLSMDDIFSGKYMKQIKAKHILFAIDACVASIGRRLSKPDPTSISQFMDLNLIYSLTNEPGRTIFTAGSGAQEAIDEEGKGGIFTTALINALKGEADLYNGDRNGVTIMNELETYLVEHVTSEARLKRWHQEPARFDFGKGEFIFFHYPQGQEIKASVNKR